MPFIAECPYCKKGRLQCSDRALGWSGTCPNPECGLSFTLAKAAPPVATPTSGPRRRGPRLVSAVQQAPTLPNPDPAVATPGPDQSTAAESPANAASAQGEPQSTPARPVRPERESVTQELVETPGRLAINSLAVGSLLCAGVALCWASFSRLDIVPFVLGGLGILLGIGGLLVAKQDEHGVALASVGPIIGLLTVAVLAVFPSWLDPMRGMDEGASVVSKEQIVIPLKSGQSAGTVIGGGVEWVDASKGAVQFGDLWLRLTSATIEPVELMLLGVKQQPSQRYLVLRVQAANNGVQRRIDYESWAEFPDSPPKHRPVVQASTGQAIAIRVFRDGANVVGQVRSGFIMPGKHLDDLLVFDPPPERFEYLRVELPLSAFGQEGKVHWQVPRSMIRLK